MIDFSQLDRTIHEKGRLAIMTVLAAKSRAPFADLKTDLDMSDGNLITHLRALEKAGFVTMTKLDPPIGRPRTDCSITPAGRKAFASYLDVLEQIVKAAGTAGTGRPVTGKTEGTA